MGKKEETKGMEGGNRMNNKVVKYHICPGCGHPREPCIGEKMKKLFLLFHCLELDIYSNNMSDVFLLPFVYNKYL